MRSIPQEQWDARRLRETAGLPWSRTEGGKKAQPLRSTPHVQFLPTEEERSAVEAEALPVGNSGHSGNAGDTPGGESSGASTPMMPGTPMWTRSVRDAADDHLHQQIFEPSSEMDVEPGMVSLIQTLPESLQEKTRMVLRVIGEDVAALEDAAVAFMPEERRQQLREDEIVKLEQMQVFEVIEQSAVPKGTRILFHKWVETPEKARLTAADKKEYGAADDLVHCPTPSAATNAALEVLATVKNYCFRCFDVTSAFPHAEVVNPWVVMHRPKEWVRMGPGRENKRWRMKKALYG